MKTKKLSILYTDSATAYWGQERYIHRLMRVMRDAGHHVEMLCQPKAALVDILRKDGFTVHTFDFTKRFALLRNFFAIRALIKKNRYNIVNTNSRKDTIHVGIAAKGLKPTVIVRTRHLAKKPNSLLSYSWIPHRVIAVSQLVRGMLTDRGIPPDHVGVVYPAVDLPTPLPPQTLRQELGLADNTLIVGSIAALRRDKGFDDLLTAMQPILQSRDDVVLVVIGEGDRRKLLTEQINQLQLSDKVFLLGQRHDVPALIGDFSLFALATHIEATGTVFAEAAAVKLPTVGYLTTGVPEMVSNGNTGILVPLRDTHALGQAISQLLNSPTLRQQMGQAGYRYAIEDNRFTLNALQQHTEHHYYRWLEQRQ